MAQRCIGVFVRHELAWYCTRDCPRTISFNAADAGNDQSADTSLCAVTDVAPSLVVIQVDLSCVLVYGMLSADESHDAVDVAAGDGRLHAAIGRVQCRLDNVVIGQRPVVYISQRHTDVSDVGRGH